MPLTSVFAPGRAVRVRLAFSEKVLHLLAGIPGLALLTAFGVALGLAGSYSGALLRRFALTALRD